ncbi:MAG: pilus assembly protein PilM [Deferribacteraceae bacterium]|jgi:type IV pilus assembly protein PilM|nr:pilus assembly protein PilM [Deferribacteraceae bacterium]
MNKYVGLDLGISSIKAVELITNKEGKLAINNAYILKSPPDAVVDGTIVDYQELSGDIAKVFITGGFKSDGVALALKGSNVIAKKARIPFLSKLQLENDLHFILDQYMKIDLEEYAVSYNIVEIDTINSNALVVFAAMRKDSVSDYASLLESAQLLTEVMNVEAFALCNLYSFMKLPRDNVSLIAHIGHSSTQFVFLNKGIFSHHETSANAGSYCTTLIINAVGVAEDKAELMKISPEAFPEGELVKKIITEGFIPDFIKSFEQAVNIYLTLGNMPPARIFLSGGGAKTFGLEDALKEQTTLDIAVMNPGSHIEINSNVVQQLMDSKPAIFNVAIGMVLD